jgi:hypothetical protein
MMASETDYSGHSANVHALLARELYTVSEFLTKLGFVETPEADGAKAAVSAIGNLMDAVLGNDPLTKGLQRKVYLGTLKQPVTTDTLRCIVGITGWAKRLSMDVRFEHDGRMYLTSGWWNYKDPNQLPWDHATMTFDLLSLGLE